MIIASMKSIWPVLEGRHHPAADDQIARPHELSRGRNVVCLRARNMPSSLARLFSIFIILLTNLTGIFREILQQRERESEKTSPTHVLARTTVDRSDIISHRTAREYCVSIDSVDSGFSHKFKVLLHGKFAQKRNFLDESLCSFSSSSLSKFQAAAVVCCKLCTKIE